MQRLFANRKSFLAPITISFGASRVGSNFGYFYDVSPKAIEKKKEELATSFHLGIICGDEEIHSKVCLVFGRFGLRICGRGKVHGNMMAHQSRGALLILLHLRGTVGQGQELGDAVASAVRTIVGASVGVGVGVGLCLCLCLYCCCCRKKARAGTPPLQRPTTEAHEPQPAVATKTNLTSRANLNLMSA